MSRALWGVCLFAGLLFGQTPQPTGPTTLEHWIVFAEVLGRDNHVRSDFKFDQPLEVRRENQLRDLEELPTVGIDPDLVGYIRQLIDYGRAKARADKLMRWYHGVFVKVPAEMEEVRKKGKAMEEDLPTLRERLRKRYGSPFPEITFPDW